MKRNIRYLGILLVAQLVLAVALFFSGPDLVAVRPDTPLLSFDRAAVNRVVIEDGEGKKVALKKEGESWVLPEHFGFPADKEKANALLLRLKSLQHGTPVATTPSALKRFKVTPEVFERRITLANNEEVLATLFLGTSPGVRRVHARTEPDQAVFSVLFATHEAPSQVEGWENKDVFQVPEKDIEKIQIADLTLTRQLKEKPKAIQSEKKEEVTAEEARIWSAEGLETGASVKSDAVDRLARTLAHLRIGKVLGTEAKDTYGLNTPKLVLSLTQKEKGTVEYQIGENKGGASFVLKVSKRPEFFEIPKYVVEPLLELASQDKLIERVKATSSEKTNKEKPEEKAEKPEEEIEAVAVGEVEAVVEEKPAEAVDEEKPEAVVEERVKE